MVWWAVGDCIFAGCCYNPMGNVLHRQTLHKERRTMKVKVIVSYPRGIDKEWRAVYNSVAELSLDWIETILKNGGYIEIVEG